MADTRCWVAVASADHVRRGRHEGFMQVCHGKAAPLRSLRAGDRVAYYSPTLHFGAKDRLQAFTAIGTVLEGDAYEFDMGNGFQPFRRDVAWEAASCDAPIQPLLGRLSFTAGRASWGYALRFGLLQATASDMALIAAGMRAHGRFGSATMGASTSHPPTAEHPLANEPAPRSTTQELQKSYRALTPK